MFDIDTSNLLLEIIGAVTAILGFVAGRVTSKEGKAVLSMLSFFISIYRWYLVTHPNGKKLADDTSIDEKLDEFEEKHLTSNAPVLFDEDEVGGLG